MILLANLLNDSAFHRARTAKEHNNIPTACGEFCAFGTGDYWHLQSFFLFEIKPIRTLGGGIVASFNSASLIGIPAPAFLLST